MLFNSLNYACFLPIIFLLYWVLPHRFRWVLLLTASYVFYMCWNPSSVILLFAVTLVTYLAARLISSLGFKTYKKIVLAITVVLCSATLFFFKFCTQFSPFNSLLVPVGISFYIFQTIGYLIDVYNGEEAAEEHFGIYATYVSFFPQLIAGPIERASDLLPQIKQKHTFNYSKAVQGVKLLAWGLYKKIVVADNLAKYVDLVFSDITSFSGASILFAVICFSIQIYADFSAYSDMAKGSAALFDIDLMDNFKSPYFSHSVQEFWSRWHISLSLWLRDYVYIPLGGNRVSSARNYVNILITFVISGFWHGANLTFILWGFVFGLIVVLEKLLFKRERKTKPAGTISMVCTFLVITSLWILFRSSSIQDAIYAYSNIYKGIGSPIDYLLHAKAELEITYTALAKLAVLIVPVIIYDALSLKTDVFKQIGRHNIVIRYGIYICLIFAIMIFHYAGAKSFVYFQF